MPKVDIAALEWVGGSNYPAPFDKITEGRSRKRLGNAVGLDQYGVNLSKLTPGAASSQRHWHENEDEFIYVLEGEVTLVEDEGETVLKPGDAAGFKAGVANGHHLVNQSDNDTIYLEIGTRAATEIGHYPDVDLKVVKDEQGFKFTNKAGEAY